MGDCVEGRASSAARRMPIGTGDAAGAFHA
ncbi:hypothetical protein SAMN05443245_0739 [Paraburkholderia fungorum]|uniref:Uncharacterized protein n=1 Tax=Paraburkholderia fungorum TaxID=134537 RepID=A0A1H0ZM60_9BURK|nr:hypothetical protein SAMN05443245_0739 [Paraburkholderia fungorum]